MHGAMPSKHTCDLRLAAILRQPPTATQSTRGSRQNAAAEKTRDRTGVAGHLPGKKQKLPTHASTAHAASGASAVAHMDCSQESQQDATKMQEQRQQRAEVYGNAAFQAGIFCYSHVAWP